MKRNEKHDELYENQELELFEYQLTPEGLKLTWSDRTQAIFHPIWLRENSNHPDNRDPGTKLRITQAAFLPLDLTVKSVECDNHGNLQLDFSDGHRCQYHHNELRQCFQNPRPHDLGSDRRYWDNSFLEFDRYDYRKLCHDDDTLLTLLNTVAEFGFAFVHRIPVDMDAVEHFAKRVGPIRETNWGTVTDVHIIPNPYDLTMTALSLSPHVDNPYRLPGPGYIFMHCLKNDAVGGESTIVDGFAAALKLKEIDSVAFETLTTIQPNFRHTEDTAILEDTGPIIELSEKGEIKRIRYSNRTEQVPPLDVEQLSRYYYARQAFASIICSDEMTLKIKLTPGDGFVWDNYRILHGRTAFDPTTGERHMRHCYMDRDTVSSRHKVLLRQRGWL